MLILSYITHTTNKLFTDPKEPNQIPLVVIHAANDQNEDKQEDESQEEGEPKENSSGLADAIETPELDVEVEPLLNGKSSSLLTCKIIISWILFDVKKVFTSYTKFQASYFFHAAKIQKYVEWVGFT